METAQLQGPYFWGISSKINSAIIIHFFFFKILSPPVSKYFGIQLCKINPFEVIAMSAAGFYLILFINNVSELYTVVYKLKLIFTYMIISFLSVIM